VPACRPDFDKVADYAERGSDEMKKIPGLVDVEPGLNLNNPGAAGSR
jgi:hypothetical protein